jgi:hypothetical protein
MIKYQKIHYTTLFRENQFWFPNGCTNESVKSPTSVQFASVANGNLSIAFEGVAAVPGTLAIAPPITYPALPLVQDPVLPLLAVKSPTKVAVPSVINDILSISLKRTAGVGDTPPAVYP